MTSRQSANQNELEGIRQYTWAECFVQTPVLDPPKNLVVLEPLELDLYNE